MDCECYFEDDEFIPCEECMGNLLLVRQPYQLGIDDMDFTITPRLEMPLSKNKNYKSVLDKL